MRAPSAALIAACVLAGGFSVPVSATAKGGPDHVPPGQQRKQDALAAPAPELVAVPTAAPDSGSGSGQVAEVAPQPVATQVPTTSGLLMAAKKKLPPGLAKKVPPAPPTPAATAAPQTSSPSAVATPAATAAAATSAPVAAARSSRTAAGGSSTKVRTPSWVTARTRRAAAARAAARRRAAGTTPAAVFAPARGGAGAISAGRPAPAGRSGAPIKRTAATRPVTRVRTRTLTQTVEHVVQVIPAPLRAGLGGLALLAALLGAALAAAAVRGRRLERQRRRLTADIGLLQSALLPDLAETGTGPATVTAAYRPAEGLAAGGDFYDAFPLDAHRTAIVVGDVSGHGRDAVPLTASVRYTVRAYLEGGLGPRHVLQVAGRVLDEQLRERLVTIVVAIYDERTGLLTYASAGHPPPVVVGDEVQPVLPFASPAVGLGVATGRRQVTVPLHPGSVACFYTDGLADVLSRGERLGFERLATEIHDLGPEDGASELIARLVRRSDARPDDMAAVVVRAPEDAPAVPPGRIEELEIDAGDLRRGRLAGFLEAFGVSEGVAAAAVRTATDVIGRAGACMIAVHHNEGGATVAVEDTPHVVALPLFGRDVRPAEPAVHEEGRRRHEAGLV